MHRKDRDPTIERLRAYFAAQHDQVVCAWLFGSVARNEARDDSDVDVAVLLDLPPPSSHPESGIALAGDIESSTGLPVDVVILNSAPPELVHRVLRDGIILFERGRSERIASEVKAQNEYFDLKPYLDEESDIREQRFIVHTLQLAAQAALDVASHVVSDQRLGEPRTNRELFHLLGKAGWLSPELTVAMRNLAGRASGS